MRVREKSHFIYYFSKFLPVFMKIMFQEVFFSELSFMCIYTNLEYTIRWYFSRKLLGHKFHEDM